MQLAPPRDPGRVSGAWLPLRTPERCDGAGRPHVICGLPRLAARIHIPLRSVCKGLASAAGHPTGGASSGPLARCCRSGRHGQSTDSRLRKPTGGLVAAEPVGDCPRAPLGLAAGSG